MRSLITALVSEDGLSASRNVDSSLRAMYRSQIRASSTEKDREGGPGLQRRGKVSSTPETTIGDQAGGEGRAMAWATKRCT